MKKLEWATIGAINQEGQYGWQSSLEGNGTSTLKTRFPPKVILPFSHNSSIFVVITSGSDFLRYLKENGKERRV